MANALWLPIDRPVSVTNSSDQDEFKSPLRCISSFLYTLCSDPSFTAGNVFYWDKLVVASKGNLPSAYLEDFIEEHMKNFMSAPAQQRPVVAKTSGRGGGQSSVGLQAQTASVKAVLSSLMSSIIGREINDDEPLMDAGLDSLGA